MIDSQGKFKERWDAFVAAVTIYKGIETPARIAFQYQQPLFLWGWDIFCYVIFITDIILRFRTTFIVQRKVVKDPKRIAIRYLRGWFIFDLIGSLPIRQMMGLVCGTEASIFWEWTAMVRFMRLAEFTVKILRKHTSAFLVRRLVVFLSWTAMVIHVIACGWIMIGGVGMQENLYATYLRSVYWTITTLSTTGYGDIVPHNNEQTFFALMTMVVGAGIYATMIANIASLLTRMDEVRAVYQEKLQRLHTFMKYRRIPHAMRKQILNYYTYSWEAGLGYDEESVLEDLPPSLRRSVILFLNKDIVEKVPLFKKADEAVLHKLVMHMKSAIYMPGDYIFREGEIGKTMYFINHGKVEVISDKNSKTHVILEEGDFFGEVALLNNTPRNASVRALDFCTLYSLDREAFETVLEEVPDFSKQIKKVSQERG